MKRDRGLLRFMPARSVVSPPLRVLCRPLGLLFRPPAEFGTPARRAISPKLREVNSSCCPSGTGFHPPAVLGTPVRRAARRGRLWGYAPFSAPLASPPRSTPKEGLSTSLACEGNAAIAAGASLTRYARSGDLPPRRVNARVRFRFGQTPFQPTTIDAIAGSRNAFVPFQLFQDVLTPRTWEKSNCITNMAASFTLPVVMVIAFQP